MFRSGNIVLILSISEGKVVETLFFKSPALA